MQQGKQYTSEQVNKVLKVIQENLTNGQSRNNACIMAGISPSTLSRWLKLDDELAMKVSTWESNLNYLARDNIASAIKENNLPISKWYLEKTDNYFNPKFMVEADTTIKTSYPLTQQLATKDPRVARTVIESVVSLIDSLPEDLSEYIIDSEEQL